MTTKQEEIKQLKTDLRPLSMLPAYTDNDPTFMCARRLMAQYGMLEADSFFDVIQDEEKQN